MRPDIIVKRLEEIGTSMDAVIGHHLNVFDESFREIRKIVKILSVDEEFVKLDKLGVLSDDDDPKIDGGKPFTAMLKKPP